MTGIQTCFPGQPPHERYRFAVSLRGAAMPINITLDPGFGVPPSPSQCPGVHHHRANHPRRSNQNPTQSQRHGHRQSFRSPASGSEYSSKEFVDISRRGMGTKNRSEGNKRELSLGFKPNTTYIGVARETWQFCATRQRFIQVQPGHHGGFVVERRFCLALTVHLGTGTGHMGPGQLFPLPRISSQGFFRTR